MKRKSIIIAVSVAAVVILGGAGFYSYSSYQKSQQEIASHIAELKEDNNNDLTNFDNETDRSNKMNILKDVLDDLEVYLNDTSKFGNNEELINEYKKNIDYMKQWFLDDYEKNITDNTIADDALASDSKDHINGVKANLDNVLNNINNEREIIANDEVIDKDVQTINDLKAKYDARLNAIATDEQKRAEEEASAQKAKGEEAKKQQEQNKQSSSKSNNGSSNKSNSNGGGNKNNGGSSKPSNNGGGSGNPYKDPSLGYERIDYTQPDGRRTSTFYYDDGTVWFYDHSRGTWEEITGNPDLFG